MQHRNPGAPVIAFCLEKSKKHVQSSMISLQLCFQAMSNQNGHYLTTVKYAISRIKDICPIMPKYYQQRYPTEIPDFRVRFRDHACTEFRLRTPLSNRSTTPDSILSYESPNCTFIAYLPSVLPEV